MNLYLSPFKILTIMLLALLEFSTVVVNAAPLALENEWTAVVIPITRAPVTTHQVRNATKIEPFQKWWNSIATSYPKRFWTTVNYFPLNSTFRRFSYSGMDLSKNYNGKNPHDEKKFGKNKHEKNKGGKNRYDKHCGKNLHREHCSKNQCDKPFGKNRHEKHCAKNQNSDGHHGKNYHEQNKLQKMKKCNKRKEFIVDNKVIVHINKSRTPSTTLLPVKTTVPVLVSTTHKCVEKSSIFSFVDICILIYCICFLIAVCLIRM
ncbi:uncharacterized protein LOC114123686 [Aphis gossypii]|uniref:Uncharacterized protein n=1 Tax=Aphis gossypii TaxID=80765 RepID=A0A9P0IXK7_APHGO|nr:uncharacterized protein LOC114123686 [Aphis gossypii]CAH1720390.1 unnamed protein product [Aphis gossypii]